jgi:LEA14-like dessication related protein
LRIENPRLESFGLNESTLAMDLRYFNPNKSRLKLKEAEGDAYIDGTMLGHFNMDTLINIPANEEFILPVKLKVDMKTILQNSITSFLKNEVMIKLDGKAKVGKGSFFIRYPIRYEGKQNLSELMKKIHY